MSLFAALRGNEIQAFFIARDGLVVEKYASHQSTWQTMNRARAFKMSYHDAPNPSEVLETWNNGWADWPPLAHRLDKIVEIKLAPGQLHKRIARPEFRKPTGLPVVYRFQEGEYEKLVNLVIEYKILFDRLKSICEVVMPDNNGVKASGLAIRQQLILTCNTIEGQFRAILDANSYSRSSLGTSGYVKLKDHLKLKDYTVGFHLFPGVGARSPFGSWCAKRPTKSLEWYDRYNHSKHSPESFSGGARLQECFDSLLALFVLIVSQFGTGGLGWIDLDILKSINVVGAPQWELSEGFIHPSGDPHYCEHVDLQVC